MEEKNTNRFTEVREDDVEAYFVLEVNSQTVVKFVLLCNGIILLLPNVSI